MIAATVFDAPGREPLLPKDEEDPEESTTTTTLTASTPHVHMNILWLFAGLLLGVGLQIGWTFGIFLTLASLAQQTTLQVALVVVTGLLLCKCLCLNMGAYWVLSQMDNDEHLEHHEAVFVTATTDEETTNNSNSNQSSTSTSNFMTIHSLTPLLEITIGGVVGMFLMALAMQIAPYVDPTVVSITASTTASSP